MSVNARQKYLFRGNNKPIYGEFEDKSIFFRCLNCGFIRKKDRDYYLWTAEISEVLLTEDGFQILTEDGMALETKDQEYEYFTRMGCPFCGYLGRI